MLLTILVSSITQVEPLKATLYDHFGISVYFVYFIFMSTTLNLHMANPKLRNSDSAYSLCFGKVLLRLFTFLINTADIEIYRVIQKFCNRISIAESCEPIGISSKEKDYLNRLLNYSLQSNFHSVSMILCTIEHPEL